jgi:formate dehydrogenase subunit delta
MNIERLIAMANDIGRYFAAEPDQAVAVAGIADHLKRFWEPRMRRQIVAHLAAGGEGLDSLTRMGVGRLRELDHALTVASSAP